MEFCPDGRQYTQSPDFCLKNRFRCDADRVIVSNECIPTVARIWAYAYDVMFMVMTNAITSCTSVVSMVSGNSTRKERDAESGNYYFGVRRYAPADNSRSSNASASSLPCYRWRSWNDACSSLKVPLDGTSG
jgi:hypothetical protein